MAVDIGFVFGSLQYVLPRYFYLSLLDALHKIKCLSWSRIRYILLRQVCVFDKTLTSRADSKDDCRDTRAGL